MDSRSGDEGAGAGTAKEGGFRSSGIFYRADKVDLKRINFQLETMITKAWGKHKDGGGTQMVKEEWEIDPSKLEITHFIARGTYGTVYRANYQGQDVAVKLLKNGTTDAQTTALRASFLKEVTVWHKIDHPNVTKFVGASMGTRDLKILLEYLPGGTLKQYLIKNMRTKLPYKVVIRFALDLSRGLTYLHSRKIVHRDIKTENMLLDTQSNLKIADFGVARVEAQNPKDMTGETGTLGYMAPEVLQGKPYNTRCDVYSFGICLWEIYCCDMPYPNLNLSFADFSSAVVRKNLRPKMPRCCPSALANIMRKCWDANPDKRPDMNEVVTLLEAIDTSKGGGMIPGDEAHGCLCFRRMRGP